MSILPDGRRSADGRREIADFVSGNESSELYSVHSSRQNSLRETSFLTAILQNCRARMLPSRACMLLRGRGACGQASPDISAARFWGRSPPPVVPWARIRFPVPIAERARGAERVVAGRVSSVTPEWQTNDYGDRLIVSVVRVNVTETMKGESSPTIDVEVEGGTIGTLTLRVSDQLTFTPGERAMFFVRRNRRGRFVPHLRGPGNHQARCGRPGARHQPDAGRDPPRGHGQGPVVRCVLRSASVPRGLSSHSSC